MYDFDPLTIASSLPPSLIAASLEEHTVHLSDVQEEKPKVQQEPEVLEEKPKVQQEPLPNLSDVQEEKPKVQQQPDVQEEKPNGQQEPLPETNHLDNNHHGNNHVESKQSNGHPKNGEPNTGEVDASDGHENKATLEKKPSVNLAFEPDHHLDNHHHGNNHVESKQSNGQPKNGEPNSGHMDASNGHENKATLQKKSSVNLAFEHDHEISINGTQSEDTKL